MKRIYPKPANRAVLANGRDALIIAVDLYQPEGKAGCVTVDTDRRKEIVVSWNGASWEEVVRRNLDETRDGIESERQSHFPNPEGSGLEVGSNPASSTILKRKEGAMRRSGQTRAIAPAAVTKPECPPPAPGIPTANHPFRQSFRPRKRAKPASAAPPPSEADLVITRIPSAPTCEAAPVRACRVCACTDDDCSQCIAKTGHACRWVGLDLCSACQTFPATTLAASQPRRRGSLTVDE